MTQESAPDTPGVARETGSYAVLVRADYPVRALPGAYVRLAAGLRPAGPAPLFERGGGTGRDGGFGAVPRLGRLAYFFVWRDAAEWDQSWGTSPAFAALRARGRTEWLSLSLRSSKGAWDGRAVFDPSSRPHAADGRPAVLTRAAVRPGALRRFWSYVPRVNAELRLARGVDSVVGFGEIPWLRLATLSVWRDTGAFSSFAYERGTVHSHVVTLTRKEEWYSEELFARFAVDRYSEGYFEPV